MKDKKINKRNIKLKPKKQSFSFAKFLKLIKFFSVSLIVIGAVGVSTYYGRQAFQQFLSNPITNVVVEGEFRYINSEVIEDIINNHIKGSFIREQLNEMQKHIKQNPWISDVTLRRQWPDKLLVKVIEQQAIARWGVIGFVNNSGELVKVDNNELINDLPILRGAEEQAMEIMKQYQVLSQAIAPYGLSMVELEKTHLGAWALILDNGWQLLLGRNDAVKKVQGLMRMLVNNTIERQDEISVIDMRYEQGLAIQWVEVEPHVNTAVNLTQNANKQKI